VTFVPSAAQKKSFGGLPNGVVGLNATLKGTNFANRRRGESWAVSRMPDSRGNKRQRVRIRVAHVAGRRRVVTARQQSPSAIKERVPAGYDELVADVPEIAAGLRRRADLQNDRLRWRAGGFAPVEDAVAGLSVVDAAQGTQFRKFVPSEASDETEEPIEESAKWRRALREARRGLVIYRRTKINASVKLKSILATQRIISISSLHLDPADHRPDHRPQGAVLSQGVSGLLENAWLLPVTVNGPPETEALDRLELPVEIRAAPNDGKPTIQAILSAIRTSGAPFAGIINPARSWIIPAWPRISGRNWREPLCLHGV
jgi:hypothetical protein